MAKKVDLKGIDTSELYPDLIVTKTVEDDWVTIRLRFSNNHPGAMVIRVQTITPFDKDEFLPYPAGDIHVKFEASDGFEYVADQGTLRDFIKSMAQLCATVSATMEAEVD